MDQPWSPPEPTAQAAPNMPQGGRKLRNRFRRDRNKRCGRHATLRGDPTTLTPTPHSLSQTHGQAAGGERAQQQQQQQQPRKQQQQQQQQQQRGRRKKGGARGSPSRERPTAPRNSSSFIMRSKALGLNAVVSPPASTPGGRGWTGAGALTPGVADLLGDASLPSVLGANGLDVWGSNIDRIRRLEDAATAMPAVSSLSGDGLAGDTDAGPVAGAAGIGGARGDGAALPGDPTVNGYLLLNATAVERSAEHAQRLELENALLRRRCG